MAMQCHPTPSVLTTPKLINNLLCSIIDSRNSVAWIYRRVVFKLFHGGREEDNLNCLVFRREYLNGRRKCSAGMELEINATIG